MRAKQPKPRKCKVCPERFTPRNSLQVACSVPCALEHTKREVRRKELRSAREARAQRIANKPRSDLLREAQAAFNAYIRARDAGKPCISCGSIPQPRRGGTVDCGHYRSVGSCPELRFEPLNSHAQCSRCNRWLSGNVVEYRKGLIERIGLEFVEWLEGPHAPQKYTREDLIAIKKKFRAMARELK